MKKVIHLLKKALSAAFCLCFVSLLLTGCNQSTEVTPNTDTNDPDATVYMPAPSDTPTPTVSSERGTYATKESPIPFGELGTLDGITWNLTDVPYVFDLTVTDVKQGAEAEASLQEGSMDLPELASDEEYFLARVKVNLTKCKDPSSTVDFSTLTFSFVQDDGSTVYQCSVMEQNADPSLTQFREGGYVETTLIGKAKKDTQPTLVFQPQWDNGFWMATK